MDRKSRPAWMLSLVCLLPVAATGCRTMSAMKQSAATPTSNAQQSTPAQQPQSSQAAGILGSPSATGATNTTDFHAKPSFEQEFNVHLDFGKQQMKDGQFDAALTEFQKSLDACNNRRGGILAGGQRTAEQALALRKLASAYDQLGKFKQAEENYRKATSLAPNDAKIWNDTGYHYYMQGRLADAERCQRHAVKLEPDNALFQTNLGLTLAMMDRNQDALEAFTHAGGLAVAHSNLGYALAARGRKDEAREEFRKAVELQPQLPLPQKALAFLDTPDARALARAEVKPKPVAKDGGVQRTSLSTTQPKAPDIPWEK